MRESRNGLRPISISYPGNKIIKGFLIKFSIKEGTTWAVVELEDGSIDQYKYRQIKFDDITEDIAEETKEDSLKWYTINELLKKAYIEDNVYVVKNGCIEYIIKSYEILVINPNDHNYGIGGNNGTKCDYRNYSYRSSVEKFQILAVYDREIYNKASKNISLEPNRYTLHELYLKSHNENKFIEATSDDGINIIVNSMIAYVKNEHSFNKQIEYNYQWAQRTFKIANIFEPADTKE